MRRHEEIKFALDGELRFSDCVETVGFDSSCVWQLNGKGGSKQKFQRRDWRAALGVGHQAKGAEARQQVRDQTLPDTTASDSVQVGLAGGEAGQPDESDIREARAVFAQFRAGSYTGEWLAHELVRICSRSGCTPVQLMTAATAAATAEAAAAEPATAAAQQRSPHPC